MKDKCFLDLATNLLRNLVLNSSEMSSESFNINLQKQTELDVQWAPCEQLAQILGVKFLFLFNIDFFKILIRVLFLFCVI